MEEQKNPLGMEEQESSSQFLELERVKSQTISQVPKLDMKQLAMDQMNKDGKNMQKRMSFDQTVGIVKQVNKVKQEVQ